MIHLVQIGNGKERRVALVEEPHLRCLTEVQSVYELAKGCLHHGCGLAARAQTLAKGEALDYDAIYSGKSEWQSAAADRRAGRSVRGSWFRGLGSPIWAAPGSAMPCTKPRLPKVKPRNRPRP